MTCKSLGGPCEHKFTANTFEEIVELSKNHGAEMSQAGDEAHIASMNDVMQLLQNPGAWANFVKSSEDAFNALPNDA